MALFQLIYMSSLISVEPELLPSILDRSVRNNKLRGITGMMIYSYGNVLQVLEGEKEAVLQTFRVIESDNRHSGIFVLIEEEIASRQFASWSMGFQHLDKAALESLPTAAHIFKASKNEFNVRARSGDALTILKSFADGSMGLI